MSHHPKAHKAAIVRTLFTRAGSLSSTALSVSEERQKITQALRMNNYLDLFVEKTLVANHSASSSEQQQPRTSIVIPYVRGLSETLKCILAEVNVCVIHQPHVTLCWELVHVKDPVPPEKASGVVYSILCRECSETYIGQTGCLLGTWLAEQGLLLNIQRQMFQQLQNMCGRDSIWWTLMIPLSLLRNMMCIDGVF